MTHRQTRLDIELFEANPCHFLDNAIKEYVTTSPINCLTAFNNAPIYDEPTVVFANGDDSLFQDFKKIIGDFHLTPREALEIYVRAKGWQYGVKNHMDNVSVISYCLPITYATRLSERQSSYGGSMRYNHTRWLGEVFQRSLEQYIMSLLEVMGHHAVFPGRANFLETKDTPEGLMANWSERHVAYASGLGTFGLNGLLITPKGSAVYIHNMVCDIALTPTPKLYENHRAHCLFYRDGSCRRCIERCVGGAIGEQGRSNLKCRQNLRIDQREMLKKLGQDEGLVGRAPACGLCMTAVPCEDRIPPPGAANKNQ